MLTDDLDSSAVSIWNAAASEGDGNRIAQGYAVSQRAAVARHTLEEQQYKNGSSFYFLLKRSENVQQ